MNPEHKEFHVGDTIFYDSELFQGVFQVTTPPHSGWHSASLEAVCVASAKLSPHALSMTVGDLYSLSTVFCKHLEETT